MAPKKKKKSKDFLGVLLLLLSAAVVISALLALLYFKHREVAAKQFTVVLLDVTDNLSLQEKQAVVNNFEDIVLRAPSNTSFEVFRVQDIAGSLLAPVGGAFNQIQGNADANPLISHPDQQRREWLKTFKAPLMQALEMAISADGADRSPIMESMQSVALTTLLTPEANGAPRRLILVSDLLQHTDEFSFYKSIPEFPSLSDNTNYAKLKTNLSGVDVELWVLRNHTEDATTLADLWRRIIFNQGGNVSKVVPIP
jgi:hypothetical protein